MKKILTTILVVAIVAVGAYLVFFGNGVEHIEDTNGADNYQLQTITEQDIIDGTMGSIGGPSESGATLKIGGISSTSGRKYYADKFTGVYDLYNTYLFEGSDIVFNVSDYKINGGNFQIYVVFEDEILGTVEPGAVSDFTFENVEKSGTLRYVMAGESADFEFTTTDLSE